MRFGLVVKRHVHQDDEAQPPGLRGEQVRHGRGDQAVEQHHGVVRRRGQHPGQLRPVGGIGVRPPAGHRVFAHRPAPLAEPRADPPVVGVAAAGRGRVVDVARQDDVHRTAGRCGPVDRRRPARTDHSDRS
ncbi:hypothetical protein DKT68_04460 [Micromonospora acroterricola]|uniref:Uncharacterized protein n=1 Tax=Micromonospora acroterricola TaxID=2202421 RepID=A0A317DAH9_9ACTN|nr:hypothetical protein DKT68_04460 [Micromonospora acroterricola]